MICETGSGPAEGTLTELRIGSDLNELERGLGFIPGYDILYAYAEIPMEQIYVSREHAAHPPAAVEIRLQKEEWYKNGRFTTEVSIRSDGLLLDGYPVYLAAVKLHMGTLYCKIVPEMPPNTDTSGLLA